MSGQPKYFKFQVPYGNIHQVLQNGNYKRVIFHIDLPSIARGFYNTDVIHLELANYVESFNMHQLTGQPVENPKIMFDEAAVFMNNLYTRFSNYSPYFIVFYDDGKCKQNKVIWNGYKADRISGLSKILTEDAEREVFRCIKDYYYSEFVSKFTIPNVSKVLYWKEYEADLIPHFIIKYQLLDSHNPETLNVILSTDKDLLQTCVFKNVL